MKQTLTELSILQATPLKTYIHVADIYRACRAKGFTIRKTNDCLIAAVAIEYSCELLYKDKDFKDFISIAECVDLRLYMSNISHCSPKVRTDTLVLLGEYLTALSKNITNNWRKRS